MSAPRVVDATSGTWWHDNNNNINHIIHSSLNNNSTNGNGNFGMMGKDGTSSSFSPVPLPSSPLILSSTPLLLHPLFLMDWTIPITKPTQTIVITHRKCCHYHHYRQTVSILWNHQFKYLPLHYCPPQPQQWHLQ
jgi:hypothetical protein